MSLWTDLLAVPVRFFSPRVQIYGNWRDVSRELVSGMSIADLWDKQPYIRTVVGFLAANVSQLGLHTFERQSDEGRRRDRTSMIAQALRWTDGTLTPTELIFALVGDLKLYDRAYWFVGPSESTRSGWMIRRLPPAWVEPVGDLFQVKHYRVAFDQKTVEVPADQVLAFTGYSPSGSLYGSPTIESLKDIIAEQIEATAYRGQLWKRGGRVSAVIERPPGIKWSDAAREAFRADWYAKYTGNGPYAGGTPILEDGMKLTKIDFSAQDNQFVEAARLSLQTVAAAFHVPADMVGLGSGANYANMRAFIKMLYTETLGPLLAHIEDRINTFLIPMLGMDPDRYYCEFNLEAKLAGDFQEQASVFSTATGRPWLTTNEARSRLNLPALDGADELVTPLNVLVGGQASPTDSGTQNEVPDPVQEQQPKAIGHIRVKAGGTDDELLADVKRFFARQRAAVSSRLGANRDDWWDQERWDNELAKDLLGNSVRISEDRARRLLRSAGLDPDDYDVDRTIDFLTEVSSRDAQSINNVTRQQLETALDEEDDNDEEDAATDSVWNIADGQRSGSIAASVGAFAAGFGAIEAGKQRGGTGKTWVVTSGNPRPSHAAMDGETVPLNEDFSNGLPWPGYFSDDVDEVAGCTCELEINF